MQTLLLLKTYIVLGDYGRVRTHAQPTQRLVDLGFFTLPFVQPQFASARQDVVLLRGVVMFVQILLAAVPRLFIVWSNRCQRPWLRSHLQRYA